MVDTTIIDQIFAAFIERGDAAYIGEPVSQTEHMLQTAAAAEEDGAGPTLIAAALLHDFGHLVTDQPDDAADHGVDTVHEELGAAFLGPYFVPAVTEPTRLHVAAKRYLCAVDPQYLEALSPASRLSLALQGGPFTPDEAQEFMALSYAQDAVSLRRYDDIAKEPGRPTPDLEHYRPMLQQTLRTSSAGEVQEQQTSVPS